jgi:hypothetical protein
MKCVAGTGSHPSQGAYNVLNPNEIYYLWTFDDACGPDFYMEVRAGGADRRRAWPPVPDGPDRRASAQA